MLGRPREHGRLLLLLGASCFPRPLLAQTRVEWQPRVAIAELYDDNLFSAIAHPETDRLTRASAGLGVEARGLRLSSRALYSLDAEKYERHEALDTPDARRFGMLELRYAGGRGFHWAAAATSTKTRIPGELVPAAGLDLGRRPASQWSTSETIGWSWGRRTSTTISHTSLSDSLSGGISGSSQLGRVSLERLASSRTRWSLEYTPQYFVSAGVATLSQGVQLGLARTVSRSTDLALKAGPRVTGREVDPELDLSLRHRFSNGEASLSVGQGQLRIVGYVGVATARRAAFTLSGDVVPAVRVSFSPAVSLLHLNGADTTAFQVLSEVRFLMTRWLSLIGSHQLADTRGGLAGGEHLTHGVLEIRLAVSRPAPIPARGNGAGGEGSEPQS